jgi:hypothetical protein
MSKRTFKIAVASVVFMDSISTDFIVNLNFRIVNMRIKLFFGLFFSFGLLFAQQSKSPDLHLLRGQVLYRNSFVQDEAVVNSTRDLSTITDQNGAFEIYVAVGDELVFKAVNYQLEVVKITTDIIQNNRLVVEVTERVNELDEVVVGPENQQKFIELKNEEFKGYDYGIDRSTPVQNTVLSPSATGMRDGLNFVAMYKLLKSLLFSTDPEKPSVPLSKALRTVYEDDFFINDLGLELAEIELFLKFCDETIPARDLLRKENEFELIEFLVNSSATFKEQNR